MATEKKAKTKKTSKPFVIVRTRDAGVHCGTLETSNGIECTLSNARRIWRWRGANTLHELSLRGALQEYTRISEPVTNIAIVGVAERITCTPEARKNLEQSRWGA